MTPVAKDTEKTAAEAPQGPVATHAADEPATGAGDPESGASGDPEADPEGAALDHKLQAWLHGHIAGGPIARNTDCWNALWAALPALKAELLKGD